uniref:Uncharacterized protein n=1 Tax=Schistosoma japonicum TaxID=6182 RepID=C1L3Y3_SCHJA|nr:hypothetical protein [Schistosoma japonicum]
MFSIMILVMKMIMKKKTISMSLIMVKAIKRLVYLLFLKSQKLSHQFHQVAALAVVNQLRQSTATEKEPRVNSRRTVTNRVRYVFADDDDAPVDSDDSNTKQKSKVVSRKRRQNDGDSDFEPEKFKKSKSKKTTALDDSDFDLSD